MTVFLLCVPDVLCWHFVIYITSTIRCPHACLLIEATGSCRQRWNLVHIMAAGRTTEQHFIFPSERQRSVDVDDLKVSMKTLVFKTLSSSIWWQIISNLPFPPTEKPTNLSLDLIMPDSYPRVKTLVLIPTLILKRCVPLGECRFPADVDG